MNYSVRIGPIVVGLTVWLASPVASIAQDNSSPVKLLFKETSYNLEDVTFIDADTGWAVGDVHWDQVQRREVGTIIKTIDGGVTWMPQIVGVDEFFNAVEFIDANTGWVVGENGSIVHTTDSGQTWIQQAVDTDAGFRDVAFVDASSGWAVATIPIAYDDFFGRDIDWDASLWHTNNGGQTWQQQTIPDTASILHGVDFVDVETGWAVGSKRIGQDASGRPEHAGVIYHTADGGQTWTEQYSPDQISLTAVDFVDDLYGWAVGFPTRSSADQRAVFHTNDGGQTWQRQEAGSIFAPLWDAQFIDRNRGYVVGFDYRSAWGPPVFRTFDGGATWEKIRMAEANPLTIEGLRGVAVVGDRVIAIGDHDYTATTEQAWASPQQDPSGRPCHHFACLFEQHYLNPHYIFHAVFFADAQEGWVVGSKTFDVPHWGQVILHTQDGGFTWETQYEHAPDVEVIGAGLFSVHRLADVQFIDGQTGWAVGSAERFYGDGWEFYGAILHTFDGGQTWQDTASPLYDGRPREFFAVDFLDDQSGWALATRYFPSPNVHLAHTSDGGINWDWIDTGIEGPLGIGFALVQGDVDFLDPQRGWAVGGLGKIVRTMDGGVTWIQQTLTCDAPSCPLRLFAIEMIDNQTGWIGGEGLYYTANGGADWLEQEINIPRDIRAMQFLDAQYGWLAGEFGTLMRTTNSGATWEPIEVQKRERVSLNGLYFVSPERGWIVGYGGVILGYKNPIL
jgi:photosystem II stability/assembly factor-like uncharacterized protein